MAVMEDHERLRSPALDVRLAERLLAAVVDGLEPDAVALCVATDVWTSFDRIERLAVNAKTLLAARVEAAEVWKRAGARSAAEHLARLAGTSTHTARRSLEHSKALPGLADVTAALRADALSTGQIDAIVPAATADASAQARLLGLAHTTSVTELKEECLRTRAAADPDRDATHGRIRKNRRVHTYTDGEGAWNLHARGTAEDGARFESALEPIIDGLFTAARAAGKPEPRATYAFDALMALTDRDTELSARHASRKPRYLALLHLSFEALVRGAIAGEETCEIPGLGPIPVRVARELLGDAILKLVITRGVDVAHVVHLGRGPTAAQRVALLWSKPKCANEACSSTFVQIDHRVPWAVTRHTRLDELDPLCPHDHKLNTHENWSLISGKGRRAFVGPDDPRHPRNRPPP